MPSCFNRVFLSECTKHLAVVAKPYSSTLRLFNNEESRKAYLKFIKFGRSSSGENSISSLICFDTINSEAVDKLSLNLALNLNGGCVLDHTRVLDSSSPDSGKSGNNRGGTMFTERSKRMNLMAPAAAINAQFFLLFFVLYKYFGFAR